MDQDDQISNDQEIDFCTLGMFIIGMYQVVFSHVSSFHIVLGERRGL